MRPATGVIGQLTLVAVSAAASCTPDRPLVPGTPQQLVGEWASARESIGGAGTWQRSLTIAPDGRVVHRGVSYGLYPGQRPTDVSGEVTSFGRLGASPTALLIVVDSVVSRDTFGGRVSRSVERGTPPSPRDSTRYTVGGDVLTLTYYSYPADAPVLTTERLVRVR